MPPDARVGYPKPEIPRRNHPKPPEPSFRRMRNRPIDSSGGKLSCSVGVVRVSAARWSKGNQCVASEPRKESCVWYSHASRMTAVSAGKRASYSDSSGGLFERYRQSHSASSSSRYNSSRFPASTRSKKASIRGDSCRIQASSNSKSIVSSQDG